MIYNRDKQHILRLYQRINWLKWLSDYCVCVWHVALPAQKKSTHNRITYLFNRSKYWSRVEVRGHDPALPWSINVLYISTNCSFRNLRLYIKLFGVFRYSEWHFLPCMLWLEQLICVFVSCSGSEWRMCILWYFSAEKAPVCITLMNKHNSSELTINTGGGQKNNLRRRKKEDEDEDVKLFI